MEVGLLSVVGGAPPEHRASASFQYTAIHAMLWVLLIVSYFSAGNTFLEAMSRVGSLGLTVLCCAPLKII